MTEKTVRVGLWEYFTEDGLRHLAFFGDVVDIPESEIERGEKANVFGIPPAAPVSDDPVAEPAVPAATATATVGNRPKLAAPKSVWASHATARGIDVDGLDKDEIIAAVDEADKK